MARSEVDVVIPAWTETLDFLDEALASVPDFMAPIVVLNGPDAGAILKTKLVPPTDGDRVRWTVPPSGRGCFQCQARNWGLALTRSTYIAFLDADDFMLPGIEEVADAAIGHRGAYGAAITAWHDGSREERRLAGPPSMTIPHHGCYVLRRDVVPRFNVYAPHQVPNRGVPYGYRFWGAIGDDDIVMVDVDALVHRYGWSDAQAANRYWENDGYIGEGQRWPTA